MNPLLRWLTSPEWTHVVGALLHSLWQGAIIAIALAGLMRRMVNPVTRYRCALGALGMLVIASIVTWALLNAPKPAVPVAASIPVTESTVAPVAPAALNPNSTDKVVAFGRMSPPSAPTHWTAWLALVWMFGAGAMLLRAGVKVAGAENLRRSCQPLDDERMVALVAEARRAVGLARQIRVAVTDKLTSPAVVGVIVPTLILPLSLFTALTPEQIRFILLHELAHIRRGDYFANLFQLFAEALLFFNPAVWWISHQIRREREVCCDALAIELSGAPADYARTLVRVAENILHPATTAALAFGDGQREPSSLADRVQRLLVPGYRPALRLTWRAMLASLIIGGTLLVLSAVGTRSTVGAILSPRVVTADGLLPNSQNSSFGSDNTATQALATFTGILTDPQFRAAVKATSQRSGINSPNDDQVTQLSGRQSPALISAVNNNNIVTGIDDQPRQNTSLLGVRLFHLAPDFLSKATNGLTLEISSVFATNPAAGFQALLESFASNDPRPRRLMYDQEHGVVVVRATDADLDKFESAIKVLFATNSAVIFRSVPASSTAVDLSTRTFAVGPVELARALGRVEPAQVANATAMVLELMVKAGVDLKPPKTVVFKDSLGLLMVRASKAELDTIEGFLVQTNQEAAFGTLPSGKTGEARAMVPVPKTNLAASVRDNSTNLYQRLYAVDAKAMVQVLARQHDTHAGFRTQPITNSSLLLPEIRKLFASVGVDLQPPKTVYFNEPKGQLLVRATLEDLDTIEQVVHVLNDQPPQVNLKVLWVEIPQSLVNSMLSEFLTNTVPPSISRTQSLSGILTKKQMAEVHNRIVFRDGITLLSEGDVTTVSDRQCQIQTTEMKTIVTGINPKALTRPGVTASNYTGSAFLETQPMSFGPTLDVIPSLSRDQATISLRIVASLSEFLGYSKAKSNVPIYVNGKKEKTALPLPKYRLQQMTNDCVILDGQTLILGNLPMTEISKQPAGEFLTKDVTGSKTNILFVLVTPTIIDQAGNRVNPDVKSLPSPPPN